MGIGKIGYWLSRLENEYVYSSLTTNRQGKYTFRALNARLDNRPETNHGKASSTARNRPTAIAAGQCTMDNQWHVLNTSRLKTTDITTS